MVPIKNLHPGDRVKIVDKFKPFGSYRYANPVPDMEQWLGKIMTVNVLEKNIARMEETCWVWDPGMLDYIVEDTLIVPASEADFLSLLASA